MAQRDRKTIRAYVFGERVPGVRRRSTPQVFEPFAGYVSQRLADDRHVWASTPDEGPVGYLRVLDDGDLARIGRVLVSRPHRGRGLSALLMRAALDVVGDRPSRLDAQTPLAGWYTGFGYLPDGPEFVEDGIPHLPMRRP